MFKKLIFVLLLSCEIFFTQSVKILAVFPFPSRSHHLLASALAKGLTEKRHDVTLISTFSEKKEMKYREVVLDDMFNEMGGRGVNLFQKSRVHPILLMLFFNSAGNKLSICTFRHPKVQKLLKSNETFDVVIVQQFLGDALKVFAHHFHAPLVLFSTIGGENGWINSLFGDPSPHSYIPKALLSYSSEMTFIERLKNSLFVLASELNRHLIFFPAQNRILKEYFPNAPDLKVLNYNASLLFFNSHISSNQPAPLQPNMIDIGGFHIQPPKKLPDDLQKYLDNATEGVIYFSMGSNLKSNEMSVGKQEAILNTFRKLRENILWKWEDDSLANHLPNVKLGKWFPQQDILAHPNVKLFITHGGFLSTMETLYHGVPVLSIPVFGDQETNAAIAVNNGYGKSIRYFELDEEKLTKAINELLNNQKYKENAEKRSKIMHDRPIQPMDLVNYWIEYVIRHKGAMHLKSAGLKLLLYQYHLIDIIAVSSVILLIGIYIHYIIIKIIIVKISEKLSFKTKKQN